MPVSEDSETFTQQLLNMFYNLSFYSPQFIIVAMFFYSILCTSIGKTFYYLLLVFFIISLRCAIFKIMNIKLPQVSSTCLTGLTQFCVPNDVTFSTYILSFTMFYLLCPLIIVKSITKIDVINYYIIGFFVFYIVYDVFIKILHSCLVYDGSTWIRVFLELLSGGLLGFIFSSLIYYSDQKGFLFINEISGNREICSMPSKQQFRCSVYKNGDLIGTSLT